MPFGLVEILGMPIDLQIPGGAVNYFALSVEIPEIEDQGIGYGVQVESNNNTARHSGRVRSQFQIQLVPRIRYDACPLPGQIS